MLYAFFWVITRVWILNADVSEHCLFHLHRQVDVSGMNLGIKNDTKKGLVRSSMSH
jgi:hypothetical protein